MKAATFPGTSVYSPQLHSEEKKQYRVDINMNYRKTCIHSLHRICYFCFECVNKIFQAE